MNEPIGRFGILQPRARTPHGVRDRRDRFLLPDDALLEVVFHPHELLNLRLHHSRDRNAGPLRHDLGDVFVGDFLAQQRAALLHLGELRRGGIDVALQLRQRAVAQLGGLVQIALALGAIGGFARLLQLCLQRGDLRNHSLLALPLRLQAGDLLLQLRDLALDHLEALARGGVLSPSTAPASRSGAASCGAAARRSPAASTSARCAAATPPRRSDRSPCPGRKRSVM